jgi:hypothetical protein
VKKIKYQVKAVAVLFRLNYFVTQGFGLILSELEAGFYELDS